MGLIDLVVIIVMSIGAGLELLGIRTVVRDIASTQEAERRFKAAPKIALVGRAVEISGAARITPSGGRQPALEARVEALERKVIGIERPPQRMTQPQARHVRGPEAHPGVGQP
jgi:hypothetical protein